jgi:predicted amidohydrolase YtcJ
VVGDGSEKTLVLRDVRLGAGVEPVDVVVEGGRIAGVGVGAGAAGKGEVVAGEGRVVLPGLRDAHVHIVQWAAARRRVDLTATGSAREAAAVMAAAAEQRPAGEPLLGFGFRDALWPDRPGPELLSWGNDGRIVALISNDLHTAWLNAAALHSLGLADHPTGVLREQAAFDAMTELGRTTPEVQDRWVADAVRAAAARGVTAFLDFEFADNLTDWTRRGAHGRLGARVTAIIYPPQLEQAIAAGLRTGDVIPGTDGLVTVGPLKHFVDGSLNTRTALCNDPYPGSHDHGLLQTTPELLFDRMSRAAAHGIANAVHAIGDRANTLALDAFEKVGGPGRIEHAQLIDHGDLPRTARPGLVLGVQPAHAVDDRDVADRHWAGRTGRAFAYADLLRAGATLELGSDAPVSPLDPWVGIAAAVHRTGPGGRAPWHPEQAIPLPEALAAAAAGRRTIRVGDPADLVLTDADPYTAEPDALRTLPVHATLLDGRWTYGRP